MLKKIEETLKMKQETLIEKESELEIAEEAVQNARNSLEDFVSYKKSLQGYLEWTKKGKW
ncbi:MAG TPA: hypothetical protein VJ327_03140 [Patescibacteria group bacterium]|nr:hypothetical protein [Patescibacteria group bacterium]